MTSEQITQLLDLQKTLQPLDPTEMRLSFAISVYLIERTHSMPRALTAPENK